MQGQCLTGKRLKLFWERSISVMRRTLRMEAGKYLRSLSRKSYPPCAQCCSEWAIDEMRDTGILRLVADLRVFSTSFRRSHFNRCQAFCSCFRPDLWGSTAREGTVLEQTEGQWEYTAGRQCLTPGVPTRW